MQKFLFGRVKMRFILFGFLVIFLLILRIKSSNSDELNANQKQRSFVVDYDNNQFLKDGRPFQYVGGSFHYFRALPQTWQRKLRTLRSSGLNVLTTYVEWSLHNPKDGVYNWDGIADLERFIQIAADEDLLVILRPGPYICAERDMGGFPYWLLTKYPNIRLRTYDEDYLHEVRLWYNQLMPKMERFLYGNGGPIIMVQVENEYGSFAACDRNHSLWLKAETQKHVKDNAVLFTNDGPSQLVCGKIDGVLATLDFGAGNQTDIDTYWSVLRRYEPKGPLVNSEYYPGWLTHWQERMARVGAAPVIDSLRYMLSAGASVNFYMFFGGTNFGFTAGANDLGLGGFNADVTSYDYDAPMDEAGDPTAKFMLIRDAIKDYLPLPDIPVPQREPKMRLDAVKVLPRTTLLSNVSRQQLGSAPILSKVPLTFEAIDQYSGFVLYETDLPRNFVRDPSLLVIENLRDRAHVFVDNHFLGILSRENIVNSLPISAGFGDTLQILVENQGRINYGIANDFKGILGAVKLNNVTLDDWTITGFPLDNYDKLQNMLHQTTSPQDNSLTKEKHSNKIYLRTGPTIFEGSFEITSDKIYDTYFDSTGWGKGIIFINGFNLGRYWPLVGPQVTVYVPKEILKSGKNSIVILELQTAPDNNLVYFTDNANLDGF